MNTCKLDSCTNKVHAKDLCMAHYQRSWYEQNKDRVKATRAIWNQQNKQRLAEYNKRWAKNNADKVRKYAREYMAANSRNVITIESVTDNVKDRFYAKVDKTSNGCWVWTGAKTAYRPKREIAEARPGYGVITINNRPFYAHRLAMLMKQGFLTENLVVDHLCDNSLCVNPDHLQETTNRENTMRSPKHSTNVPGGYKYAKTHCKYGHVRTPEQKSKACLECYLEKHPKSKLKNA